MDSCSYGQTDSNELPVTMGTNVGDIGVNHGRLTNMELAQAQTVRVSGLKVSVFTGLPTGVRG